MRTAPVSAPFPQRIVGIDPGLRRTGFGIIDKSGHRSTYVTSGVIAVPEGALPERLRVIFAGITEIIERWSPTESAIEQVFVNVNPASTLLLGQARGAAITALAHAGLPVAEYGTMQIKQAVAGHGRARKDAVQQMVMRLLSLPSVPQADAADALACALTHAQGSALLGALTDRMAGAQAHVASTGGVASRSAAGALVVRGSRRGAGLRAVGEAVVRARRGRLGGS